MNTVFRPETIVEEAFPGIGQVNGMGQSSGGFLNVSQPQTYQDTGIATPNIANDVIATSFNTQNRHILGAFTFGKVGAIQIGQYESGVSGDVRISPNGITARNSTGATTFALDGVTGNATFLGTVVAGSIITGYLQVGSAASDVNAGITTISGGKITTGSITATQIAASTITASRLAVSQLSAITADMGNISAGTITGAVIRTASSGARFELTGSGSKASVYNSGGTERIRLDGAGLGIFQTNSLYFGDNASTVKGIAYYDSNQFNIASNSGVNLNLVTVDTDINLVSSNNIVIHPTGQTFFTNDVHVSGKIYSTNSAIQLNGVDKTAIVDTSEGFKALYCMESPEVWFMDFIEKGHEPDPLFLEVTEGAMLSPDEFFSASDGKQFMQVWRHRKGHGFKRFESKTREEFLKNENFYRSAK